MPELARAVYDAVAVSVPYDFACFATTDPTTGVITWASKTRDLGVGDVEFAAAEYGPPDVNKFDEIAVRTPPVGVLSVDTEGDVDRCRRHREFMAPRFGFTDELRAAFVSRSAVWGVVAIYRGPGEPPFTPVDAAEVGALCPPVAAAVQRTLFRQPSSATRVAAADHASSPAVIIVDASDRVTHLTPSAREAIDELGGFDHGSLPAGILAVVAATRTAELGVTSRARTESGAWLSVRTAPLEAAPGLDPDVVVTVDPTPRTAVSRLTLAAHGLTVREEDVALQVLQGASTADIAATLHLSPYTVQDHLKTVFAKLGVTSRREMTARLMLGP